MRTHLGVSSSSSYWLVAASAAAAVATFAPSTCTAEARLTLNQDPKTLGPSGNYLLSSARAKRQLSPQQRQQQQRQLQEKMANQRKASALQLPPAVRTSIRSLSELGNMVHDNQGSALDERGLFETHKYFPECIGLSVEECEALIEQEIVENPDVFPAGVVFDVRNKRQITDDTYNFVVLVTNDEDHVIGRLGDGVVEYPFVWRKNGVEVEIGPWDCDVGTPLTSSECCTFIKASVPGVDDNGRELEVSSGRMEGFTRSWFCCIIVSLFFTSWPMPPAFSYLLTEYTFIRAQCNFSSSSFYSSTKVLHSNARDTR